MSEHPTPRRGEFRSDLAQTPLPEVLVTIYRYKVPGIIECTREGEEKKIFIDEGNIIFATSNLISDSLGDRLLNEGKISIEQYRESVRRLNKESGKRQGSILVEMRALEPKDLFIAVREQVESIVWSIFDWENGSVVFTPGRDKQTEFIKLTLPIPAAIFEGVQRLKEAKRLIARIGNKTTVLERTETAATDLTPGPTHTQILDSVDGKKTLYELISLPYGSPSEIAKTLYSLFAFKLIAVKPQKQIKIQLKTGR
jgi:hypothetical protein